MVFVTGDTHGDWISRLNFNAFPEQREMTKDDCVIVLGDFGIWDNSIREKDNLDWLENRSFTTVFVDGNHSNFDILDNMPVSEWHGGKVHLIRPSVIHLMRGEIFTIDNKKFFAFGGASSHDIRDGILEADDPRMEEWSNNRYKLFRINHVSWWDRELPSQEEMENGIINLEKNNNKVNFILTHSPSASMNTLLGHGLYRQDRLTEYLEDIRSRTEYDKFFCGHMHINSAVNDKDLVLYEQIIRIV